MNLADALAAVDPLTIGDLVALPDLQTRTDRKYVLSLAEAADVLGQLSGWRSLDIHGERSFAYHSRYFDTDELDSFRSSATGRRRRFKVRVRTYLSDQRSTLEVKTKGVRGVTVKSRRPLDGMVADRFDELQRAFIDSCVGVRIATRLEPIIETAYDRATLVSPESFDGVVARATFDTNLGYALPSERTRSMTGDVIIETKAPLAATQLDRVLWARGIRPVRLSKFGVAMVLGHDLAGNRWNRVLREHCDWAPGAATLSA